MSYQSEVLADTPALYYRLDMVGAAHNGDTIPDLSGNTLDGSLSYNLTSGHSVGNPIVEPYGYGSPIETDPASREIFAQNSFLEHAQILCNSDSLIEPAGDFTLEAWIRPTGALGYNPQDCLGKKNACYLGIYNNGSGLGGAVYDSASTIFHSTDSGFVATYGQSYHCVLVRLGNALAFYINAVLKHTTTITSGLPTQVTGDQFYISPFQSGDCAFRADEVAFYTHALSGSRILVHYEAAKAPPSLRATITVMVGVELNTDQITPVDFGFAHNFSDTFGDSQIPIVEEIAWKTNVNQSEPDYQQRVSARPHGAYRSLEYHLSPSSGAGRARLQGALYTPAEQYLIPVWSDSGVTTGAASSGTNQIPVDTTKRDYQVGSYCGACADAQTFGTYQFFKILAVSDTQLTLGSNIATTIPSGSIVFPARLASISDDSLSVKSFAADHEDQILRFEILETELSTRRITAYTPSTTYKSIEVFSLEAAKVTWLDERPYTIGRRIQARGRDYQYARDTGSPQTFPVRLLLADRSALSDFYGWLDARQGKLNPVWVSSRERDLTVTARPSGSTLTVSPKTGFSFHHGRRDIEFLKTDGTYSRVRVTAVTDNGSTETWTFDATVPLLADISRASFLKFCTLAQDSIQVRYFKGGSSGAVIAEATVQFRELLTSPV
jgi:hypothetical protein